MIYTDRAISIVGEWGFALGSQDAPVDELPGPITDSITLPGTTGTNRKGPDNGDRSTSRLAQPHLFIGPCWYTREIDIPESWHGKRVRLFMERTKFTRVWFDGRLVGEQPWICTPQEYVLHESIAAGKHRLTVLVDNRRLPPFGADAHQISENTQGNWNGIIGRIELIANDPISIRGLQVYPDSASRSVDVAVVIDNVGPPARARLQVNASGPSVPETAACVETLDVVHGEQSTRVHIHLGPDTPLWDEFHPNLIHVEVFITAEGCEDRREIRFGLRDFTAISRHFEINDRPIFLRGRHDGCVFPLTGHPPMDRSGWLKYFLTCREYGLNHVRFHTWTPPEAAFEAADELGFYLQPELPYWGDFTQEAFDALLPEGERILRHYGNHPSFVMFSLGNEHWGGSERTDEVIRRLKEADDRRLYIRGTCAFWAGARPGPYDDYVTYGDVKAADGQSFQVRGANLMPWGHVQRAEANTLIDYRRGAEANDVPTISHEIGQYTVYPDFDQIEKYVGVTQPNNLVAFRDTLAAAGMLDQNKAFARASGALAVLCYRAEIEACLRTPEYGGFQILDLQDFPGQGTALVGMLDAFMDSKGLITPEKWRSFCAPSTLLARFSRYVWTSGELFQASIALSHFGINDLPAGKLNWRLTDETGREVTLGAISYPIVQVGGLRELGDLEIPLVEVGQFTLEFTLGRTGISTCYPLWVYQLQDEELVAPDDLLIARGYDLAVRDKLAAGGRALIILDDRPLVRSVGGGFASDFWNFPMFHGKPGTMGLLCDPTTPALAGFPNDGHSDWQWASIAIASQPLVLDSVFGQGDLPIVQVIDNYARCHKLGLIVEFRVGSGRLLVCASDLIRLENGHPEARALMQSLIDYATSDRFSPAVSVSSEALVDLLRVRLGTEGWKLTASSFDPHWHGYQPEQLVDGSESRGWRAKEPGPGWCQIDFPEPTDLSNGEIVFAPQASAARYTLSSTANGETLTLLEGAFAGGGDYRHHLSFTAPGTEALKLSIDPIEADGVAEVMELHLFSTLSP